MKVNQKKNDKLFYRVLRNLKEIQVALEQLKNKSGALLTEPHAIRTKWKEHFKQLLETETNGPINNEYVKAK